MKNLIEKMREELENVEMTNSKEINEWVNNEGLFEQSTVYVPSMYIKGIDKKNYGEFKYLYELTYDANNGVDDYKEEMIQILQEKIAEIEEYMMA